jgi:uncharacterized membrane protein
MSKTLILDFIQNRFRFSLFLLLAVYAVGISSVLLGQADGLMQLTVYNLLFAAGILLYNSDGFGRKYMLWFAIVALAGYLLEVLGVYTGLVFGEYSYGAVLGLSLFSVPLIIGLNWAILVFAVAAVFAHLKMPVLYKAASAASLMLAYDFFLEPVAIRFGFWTWAGGSIPVQNYAAWWIIAFFMLLGVFYNVSNLKNRLAIYIIAIQTIFFVILILNQGLSIG